MSDDELLEQGYTVAMRAAETDGPLIEGSERRECTYCGHDVWVSPATRESIEAGLYPDRILCVQCTAEDDLEVNDDS